MNEPVSTSDPCEALTVREAAALLHVSRPTVEKYIKAGELPSALIGRCRRIRRVDLEAFLERRAACGWRAYAQQPLRLPAYPDSNEMSADDIPF